MRIGTNVLLLPLYHPVRLAEDCATVDILSHGRFELGVGFGYRPNEFQGYGIPYKERAGRTNEGLEIIRRSHQDVILQIVKLEIGNLTWIFRFPSASFL